MGNQGNQRKRRGDRVLRAAAGALAAAVLLLSSFGQAGTGVVHGAEKRTVRVAFFPMEGYHVTLEDGSLSGMDVEYLENLGDYVNWNVEYVPCDSWDDALQMLADKEVDLVGSAQYSAARAEIYRYADLASGYTFGAVAVQANSGVAYEDFSAMQNLTYGCVATYVRKQEFLEYLKSHGIESPRLREYENTAALQDALASRKIDALVHSLTEIREGQRVVGRFAPMPFYYITYPGNDDLLRELNQGVADLKMNRPELENELMAKYYDSRLDHTILLTSEEKRYIEEKQTLTVGWIDDCYPFSYASEAGSPSGLVRQILEEVAVSTGLSFDYVRMENMETAKQSLAEGKIDMINYCSEGIDNIRQWGGVLTKVYAQVPRVVVMKRDSRTEEIKTLAVTGENLYEEGGASLFAEGQTELMILESPEECLQAVRMGEAEAALCDGYLA
ncbi:MAG: transporter substrate-binding domain-containing protein, partial [Lachnospiraceae bacterium]|nr:transporter substrate-binding domain-containing protein [Lachnospiraceae bacterium]